jgi:hypothetical protein
MRRYACLTALAAIGLLTMPGLSKAAGLLPGLPFCGNDLEIVPGTGIGPLVVGLEERAATTMLGPLKLASVLGTTPPSLFGNRSLRRVLYTGGPGAGVGYIAANDHIAAVVVTAHANALAPGGCRTAEGISPSSPEDDVLRAYGPPDRTAPDTLHILGLTPASSSLRTLIYDARGIAFETSPDHRVVAIWIFRVGQFCTWIKDAC